MVAAMVQGCGMKVGLYTSPHVLSVRERISVDGEMIGEAALAKAIGKAAMACGKARISDPTYFEIMTAAAFYHFASENVNMAVIETGLGGRLDATNVIEPEVVGITSISLDHVQQLGNDLASIAREKAGVFKDGIPIVAAPQRPVVRQVLADAASAADAQLRYANEGVDFSYRFEFSRAVGRHARICLTTPTSRFEHLHVPVWGEHQAINCAVALGVVDQLKVRGLPIDDQRATMGLSKVRLLGRTQIISNDPRILVDGAHNADSVDALMRAVGQNVDYDSMVVVFGCHRDKDVAGMLDRIRLGADKIIFTRATSPRSADPEELATMFAERSSKMAQTAPTLEDAMQIALGAVTREDLISVTGSFYLVAEAIRKYATLPYN